MCALLSLPPPRFLPPTAKILQSPDKAIHIYRERSKCFILTIGLSLSSYSFSPLTPQLILLVKDIVPFLFLSCPTDLVRPSLLIFSLDR